MGRVWGRGDPKKEMDPSLMSKDAADPVTMEVEPLVKKARKTTPKVQKWKTMETVLRTFDPERVSQDKLKEMLLTAARADIDFLLRNMEPTQ